MLLTSDVVADVGCKQTGLGDGLVTAVLALDLVLVLRVRYRM